ncbi:FecCD family ABC transporter permease [Patulibacter minatonensis]|uniref:FecCD family ABC transporter permease n=1 Tax=Patulibacter minatonensis TaxID=298163 RepID=UPI00047ABF53|nr:iron chelate uptake ABC transporter family permease subunit [Patulibacter minatonensis]
MSGRRVELRGGVIRLRGDRISLRVDPRSMVVGGILLVLAAVVGVFAIGTGDFELSVGEVLDTIVGNGPPGADVIISELRLPRLLDALFCGAALGVAGAIFQSLTRNPLGSPDVIGFTQGAAVGAVLQIAVFGGGTLAIAGGAVFGGFAVAAAVMLLAQRAGGTQGYRIVLIGIGFSTLLASTTAFLLTKVSLETSQSARLWLVGSLNGRGWEHVVPVGIALAVLVPCALVAGRSLRMLEMGDDTAAALGVSTERSRLALVAVGVALAAVATASTGPVAFVALAAPQLARRLTGATGPGLIPSALMGGLLLAASDLAAQRVFPSTPLPVGVMTGAVGGVYLMWLLFNEWHQRRR